jgi:glucose dehydrogenase
MRNLLINACFGAAVLVAGAANANEELIKMSQNPKDWVIPDDHLLVDPEKTTELGKPIGKDSSLKTWQGDQWKTGGGCTWGWI